MEICGSRASTSESKGSCPQDAGQEVLWHTSSTRSRNEFIRCKRLKLLFTMASDDHFSFGLANLSLLLVASEKLYLRNFGIVKWVGVWYLPQLVIKEYQLSRLPLNLHPPEPRNLADLIFLLRSSQGWWRSTLLKLSWAAFLSTISILRNVDPGWRMVDLCLTSIPWEGKSCFAVFLGWRYFSHHQQEKSLPLIPSPNREVISDDTLPLRWRGTCQGVQAMLFRTLRRGLENCTPNIIHLSPRENSFRFMFIRWSTRS